MHFKEDYLKEQLESSNTLLKEIVKEFEWLSAKCGVEPTITRVMGAKGVHADMRAADFRDEHGASRSYTPEQVEYICKNLNTKFPRNDGFKTCIHHSVAKGPLHFHIQVAPNFKSYKLELSAKNQGEVKWQESKTPRRLSISSSNSETRSIKQ